MSAITSSATNVATTTISCVVRNGGSPLSARGSMCSRGVMAPSGAFHKTRAARPVTRYPRAFRTF